MLDEAEKIKSNRGVMGVKTEEKDTTESWLCWDKQERVSKDIIPWIFDELHHTSSKHGWQPQKHIADQVVCKSGEETDEGKIRMA